MSQYTIVLCVVLFASAANTFDLSHFAKNSKPAVLKLFNAKIAATKQFYDISNLIYDEIHRSKTHDYTSNCGANDTECIRTSMKSNYLFGPYSDAINSVKSCLGEIKEQFDNRLENVTKSINIEIDQLNIIRENLKTCFSEWMPHRLIRCVKHVKIAALSKVTVIKEKLAKCNNERKLLITKYKKEYEKCKNTAVAAYDKNKISHWLSDSNSSLQSTLKIDV